MSTYVKGNEWMIFTDYETKREHWDFVSSPDLSNDENPYPSDADQIS